MKTTLVLLLCVLISSVTFSQDFDKRLEKIYTTTQLKMMQKEKLFSQTYDTIIGLFGSNIIIAGLPKKTFTLLDMMHFVPKIFRENYLRSVNKP